MVTWVFLRGLTREVRHWGAFPDTFCEVMGDGHRVIALDLPGNGILHAQRSPASVAGMLQACRVQLAARQESGPVHVVAMSLGAMVAAQWAHVAPRELAGCVLINTSMRPFSPFFERLRPRNYMTLAGCMVPGRSAEDIERRIAALTSNDEAAAQQALAQWIALRQERPVGVANALRQLLAAARFSAPQAAPAVPLLLLSSAGDGLVHARCSQAISRAWGCAHAQHPSAGHDLPLDAPQWVASQVRQWWSSLPASTSARVI